MKENEKEKESKTGKYVYDKAAGKLVKVSDKASAAKKSGSAEKPSCGGGCCCCG